MTQNVFIATVQIAVFAESEPEACDAMTECLTNNLKYNAAIIDWQYKSENSVYILPQSIGEIESDEFEEGELFDKPFIK